MLGKLLGVSGPELPHLSQIGCNDCMIGREK